MAVITTTPINLKLTGGMIVMVAAKRFFLADFARDLKIFRICFSSKGT